MYHGIFPLSRFYYIWSMCIPYLVGIPFKHIRCVVFLPRSEALLVPIVGSMLVIPILWIPWLFDEVPEGCLVVMVGGSGKGWGGWTFIFWGGGVWGCLGLVCLGEEVRVRLTLLVFFQWSMTLETWKWKSEGGNFFFGALEVQNLRDFGFGSETLLFFGRLSLAEKWMVWSLPGMLKS